MERNTYTPEAFARLPRKELRRMLAAELEKDAVHIDDAFVRLLLTELKRRGPDPDLIDDAAVEAACEKFRQDAQQVRTPRKRWHQHWLLKVASVVLVLGILFFALPASAQATNVKDVLSWWSNGVFQFFKPGKQPAVQEPVYQTDHPGLQQIYDAAKELGITAQIVPRELSEEFQLTEFKVAQMFEDSSIYARLASGSNKILFTVVIHSEEAMLQHEKTAQTVSVWELAGVEHCVVSNTTGLIVTWTVDNIECIVTTDCPEEDVYDFIKSIYTSEG